MGMVQREIVSVMVTLVLVLLSLPTGAAEQDDRGASYLGAFMFDHELNEECADAINEEECVTRIPKGVISVHCDGGEGHPWTGGLYDGIGGVMFCGVPVGSTITLTMEDEVVEVPEALVTCPGSDPSTEEHDEGALQFAYLEGSVTTTVPEWCFGEDLEHTEVSLFNIAGTATTGTTYLEFTE